jgi:hypothetical protein
MHPLERRRREWVGYYLQRVTTKRKRVSWLEMLSQAYAVELSTES